MINVFIFTLIHICFTYKHKFIEINEKKNNHTITKRINVSAFCPVRNLLFYSKHYEKKVYIKNVHGVFLYS